MTGAAGSGCGQSHASTRTLPRAEGEAAAHVRREAVQSPRDQQAERQIAQRGRGHGSGRDARCERMRGRRFVGIGGRVTRGPRPAITTIRRIKTPPKWRHDGRPTDVWRPSRRRCSWLTAETSGVEQADCPGAPRGAKMKLRKPLASPFLRPKTYFSVQVKKKVVRTSARGYDGPHVERGTLPWPGGKR